MVYHWVLHINRRDVIGGVGTGRPNVGENGVILLWLHMNNSANDKQLVIQDTVANPIIDLEFYGVLEYHFWWTWGWFIIVCITLVHALSLFLVTDAKTFPASSSRRSGWTSVWNSNPLGLVCKTCWRISSIWSYQINPINQTHKSWLVVSNMAFIFHNIYGMSSFPLTFIFFKMVKSSHHQPERWFAHEVSNHSGHHLSSLCGDRSYTRHDRPDLHLSGNAHAHGRLPKEDFAAERTNAHRAKGRPRAKCTVPAPISNASRWKFLTIWRPCGMFGNDACAFDVGLLDGLLGW